MEQKTVSKTEEQCIYLMKETNLDFYLIIPNSQQVSIILGLFPNITEDIVKTLPKEKDKAIVIPVINNQILTNANLLEPTSFNYLDNVLSYLINTSYKILTYNHLSVNSKVLLNNHSTYANFNQKYIEKYHDRVELYNLIQNQEQKPTIPVTSESDKQLELDKQPESTSIPIVNNITEPSAVMLSNEPSATNNVKKRVREPGFVSYVLLGVLVAVISLVFLYLMI